MTNIKRYHPLMIVFELWDLIKSAFFFFIILFVINYDSESAIIGYGRYAFYLFLGYSFISIILRWFTHKYEIDHTAFYLYEGVFKKRERTVPFSKIQNINRRTSMLHRIFNMTSIQFETGITGADVSVSFDVLSKQESSEIEKHIANASEVQANDEENEQQSEENSVQNIKQERTIHFTPTRKDTIKASFTSLSFLVLVPLVISVYFQIDDIFNIEEKAEGYIANIIHSKWIIGGLIILLILASITFGIVRTFLKYGKYEISSDDDRIYITQGVIDETAFSITKDKVQAIEVSQTFMKRVLGLAEVKLISAGSLQVGDEEREINSLYPFLPVKRAYKMIADVLPDYEVTEQMSTLSRKAFWYRMLKPSWLWIFATIALVYFKPTFFDIKQAWWILSLILLLFIYLVRILDYVNTRYALNEHFIQFKQGSFATSLFISKRDKVIEIKVYKGLIQRLLGLASIETINRAQPVHHATVADIPEHMANSFYQWYANRMDDVEIEKQEITYD